MNHCFARRSKRNFGFTDHPLRTGCAALPGRNICLSTPKCFYVVRTHTASSLWICQIPYRRGLSRSVVQGIDNLALARAAFR